MCTSLARTTGRSTTLSMKQRIFPGSAPQPGHERHTAASRLNPSPCLHPVLKKFWERLRILPTPSNPVPPCTWVKLTSHQRSVQVGVRWGMGHSPEGGDTRWSSPQGNPKATHHRTRLAALALDSPKRPERTVHKVEPPCAMPLTPASRGSAMLLLFLRQAEESPCVCPRDAEMNCATSDRTPGRQDSWRPPSPPSPRRPTAVSHRGLPKTPPHLKLRLRQHLNSERRTAKYERLVDVMSSFHVRPPARKATEASPVHTSPVSVTRRPKHRRAGQETTTGSEFTFA